MAPASPTMAPEADEMTRAPTMLGSDGGIPSVRDGSSKEPSSRWTITWKRSSIDPSGFAIV